jgi:hypothetical protein
MTNVVELPKKEPAGLGRVPPHDLDAEAVVLSAVVLAPYESLSQLEFLRPEHFYANANRVIFEAVRSLDADASVIDLVRVKGWLHDHGKLEQAGGSPYLTQTVEATPSVANVAAHGETILSKWRARLFIEACQHSAAEAYASSNPDRLAENLRGMLERHAQSSSRVDPWGASLGWDQVCSPLADMNWLCRPLGWATSLVCGIAGYGYAGKSVAAAAALVQGAASLPIWGQYGVEKPLRALYLDYEQGPVLTMQRIQRLLRGYTIGPLECASIDVRCLPPTYLSDPGAEQRLIKLSLGFDIILIDSFRAAFPALDENSSEARGGIDMLRRVSGTNNLCTLLILHGRKPSKDDVGGQKTALRGSSSIYDALSSVLMLEGKGKDGQGRNVACATHTKSRETGICLDQFELTIEDVGDPSHPRDGLMVTAQGVLSRQDKSDSRAKRESKQAREDADTLVALMRTQQPLSWRKVVGLCHQQLGWGRLRTDLVLSAVMADRRLLTSEGARKATLYRHPDVQLELPTKEPTE